MRHGKMPVLNPDQTIEPMSRVKRCQVPAPQDFVQIAMEIRQRGQEHVDWWLKDLDCRGLAASA